jgi:hypothetical protein
MRRVAGRILRLIGVRRSSQWRRRSDPVRGRRRALREEKQFWRDWLRARGGKYADEYAYRFDPSAEVADSALRLALAALEQDSVTILDVGAGPAARRRRVLERSHRRRRHDREPNSQTAACRPTFAVAGVTRP